MESLLLNLRDHVDPFVDPFVSQSLSLIKPETMVGLKVHALNVVLNAIYYNVTLALFVLNQRNVAFTFFSTWFQNLPHFKRVHDKKLSILAILTLLQLPLESIPTNVSDLMKALVLVFQSYPEALASS
jgi:hypothetical protein